MRGVMGNTLQRSHRTFARQLHGNAPDKLIVVPGY